MKRADVLPSIVWCTAIVADAMAMTRIVLIETVPIMKRIQPLEKLSVAWRESVVGFISYSHIRV
jgi:hypothetical protein